MATIVPTVLANSEQYESYILKYAQFAQRIHIDLSDGQFSPSKTVEISEIYWPYSQEVDLHIMYKDPIPLLDEIIALAPNLVIIHAEIDVDYRTFAEKLKTSGIKFGLALLAETPVSKIVSLVDILDHVLIFSGNLGHYGGVANFELISKISEIKKNNSNIEIGWDGGINQDNAQQLVNAGVDVLDVGGYIAGAENSREAYMKLSEAIA
jgi:ribulose-phosphate 3-epimerase